MGPWLSAVDFGARAAPASKSNPRCRPEKKKSNLLLVHSALRNLSRSTTTAVTTAADRRLSFPPEASAGTAANDCASCQSQCLLLPRPICRKSARCPSGTPNPKRKKSLRETALGPRSSIGPLCRSSTKKKARRLPPPTQPPPISSSPSACGKFSITRSRLADAPPPSIGSTPPALLPVPPVLVRARPFSLSSHPAREETCPFMNRRDGRHLCASLPGSSLRLLHARVCPSRASPGRTAAANHNDQARARRLSAMRPARLLRSSKVCCVINRATLRHALTPTRGGPRR